MLAPALSALGDLFEPVRLLALFGGMIVGMVFGMLPGLGGVAAVSILLPFIYLLDDYSGLAMLLGAISVVYTSDTITSVLIGAPGSPASAPTAIEGHAMAKRGEAARALAVGFLASMVGGLVGALILFGAIPIAGPLVLALGTPELFMFALLGLVFASSMVGEDVAKGLAAACLGLFLGVVGPATAAADYRFTFGQAYLLDGLSLTIVALGLFGVAEVIAMLSAGGGIAQGGMRIGGWREGVRDFVRLRWLVLRGAVIGVFGGFIPAVGASASTWVAYGHAMSSAPEEARARFGKGEVRGVAAAEGANNATVISDLVPTLLFSVPGGPAAAIFLGAMFGFGYYPGPRMVEQHPDLLFLIVWSVALTSIVGAAVCFALTPMLARLTRAPFALIAAPLVIVMVIGAYQTTGLMADIAMLFGFGALGWLMKRADWPRAPALVGFVLAGPMEQYFWLTQQLHGWSWLGRPGVIALALLAAAPPVLRAIRARRAPPPAMAKAAVARPRRAVTPSEAALAFAAVGLFAYALWEMQDFARTSRLMPSVAIFPGLALALWLSLRAVRNPWAAEPREAVTEAVVLLGLAVYAAAIWAVGFALPTVVLLAVILFGAGRMRPVPGLLYGGVTLALAMGLFSLLRSGAPPGALFGPGG
jgi:putative tricarboxylic transport membrane protein